MPESVPLLHVPDVPLTLETLRIIAPYALAVAVVKATNVIIETPGGTS